MKIIINRKRDSRRRGHAVVEVALMAPWILFLFVGALDFGFFAYAAIATENAARVAALYTSSSTATAADTTTACQLVLQEMNLMPNTKTLNSCATPTTVSATAPIGVRADAVTGADGANATRMTVTYRTVNLIPIPGILMGQMTITRSAEMRVKDL